MNILTYNNNKPFKLLSSKTVLSISPYSIRKDQLLNNINGNKIDYYVLKRKKAIFIIPFEDNCVYLISQYRYPINRTLLEVPAGGQNKEENSTECAIRELREETGFVTNNVKKIGKFFMSPGYSSQEAEVYLATNLRKSKTDFDKSEIIKNTIKIPVQTISEYIKNGKIKSSPSITSIYIFLKFIS